MTVTTDHGRSVGSAPVAPMHMAAAWAPMAIIAANFAVASLSPVTAFPWDDLFLLDAVSRVAQGQIAGIDFYNPLGFGPFHLAAMFWRVIGPSRADLLLAIGVSSAIITLCASWVVSRRPLLRGAPGFLFRVVIAFESSGVPVYGWQFWGIGSSAFYNRLTTAAIAVLMLQWFTEPERPTRRIPEILVAAALLNILFLVKISALAAGLGVMLIAVPLRSDWRSIIQRQFLPVGLLLWLFVAADFLISGVPVEAVLGLYRRAVAVRASLAGADALPRALTGFMTFIGLAILLAQVAASNWNGMPRWRLLVAVGTYLVVQSMLNISNTQPGTAFLAPPCAAILVVWRRRYAGAGAVWPGPGERIGLIASLLVAVPDGLGTIVAAGLTVASASGVYHPVVISGVAGRSLLVGSDFRGGDQTTRHAEAINRGLGALRDLGLDRLRIASLDYENPFPFLLAAPAPKRVDIVLAPGYMEQGDRLFDPDEIIGDACVLMVPRWPAPVIEDTADFLADSVAEALRTSFRFVRRDEAWDIYRRAGECPD